MNIFSRLHRLISNRSRFFSILIISIGISVKLLPLVPGFPSSRLLTSLMSWVEIISIPWGMISLLFSFTKDLESFADTLRNYVLPQHFSNLPVARTQFSYAIRELVDFYAKQHEGGYLPVVENLEAEITVELIENEAQAHSLYNIPTAPEGYSWQWFKFTIVSQWRLKPLEWGYESVFDPQNFLDEILVMSYKTYTDLFSWRSPRRDVYLPVSAPIYEDETLRSVLSNVKYLRSGERSNGIIYYVSKWSGSTSNAKQISDPTALLLEPLLENTHHRRKRQILKTAFPGLGKRPSLLNQVTQGIYEIYKCKRQTLPDLTYIHLPQEKVDSWWKFFSIEEYVLPAKVLRGTEVLWDQQSYLVPFGRVMTVRRFTFRTNSDRIVFRRDRPPELLCYPYLTDPIRVKINLIDPKTWIVEPGEKFWYPGDVIYFVWHDTLINDLIRNSE